MMPTLDLTTDPVALTAALVDIPSVSRGEREIADAVEAALRRQTDLEVIRIENNVLARTHLGRASRVILAGHLDTVPIADNVPSSRNGGIMHGCGTVDMKSGDAVFLHLAATMTEPTYDVTYIFYECEEIASSYNGLGKLEKTHPDWLRGDLAILGEPTSGLVEAGCQGTMRFAVTTSGTRAHSARSWLGDNAIHKLGRILAALEGYQARAVDIDGCVYREGLSAVNVAGGVAGNVIPDTATLTINFRFAPDRSLADAENHVREVIAGSQVEATVTVTDQASGALPGLSAPAAARLVDAAGGRFRAKYGWTDVSRFSALGIPAVNFGPGDPNLAHKPDEHVNVEEITRVSEVLTAFLR